MATKHACKGCGEKFDRRAVALDHARECLGLDFGDSPGQYVERVEVDSDRQAYFTDFTR